MKFLEILKKIDCNFWKNSRQSTIRERFPSGNAKVLRFATKNEENFQELLNENLYEKLHFSTIPYLKTFYQKTLLKSFCNFCLFSERVYLCKITAVIFKIFPDFGGSWRSRPFPALLNIGISI